MRVLSKIIPWVVFIYQLTSHEVQKKIEKLNQISIYYPLFKTAPILRSGLLLQDSLFFLSLQIVLSDSSCNLGVIVLLQNEWGASHMPASRYCVMESKQLKRLNFCTLYMFSVASKYKHVYFILLDNIKLNLFYWIMFLCLISVFKWGYFRP